MSGVEVNMRQARARRVSSWVVALAVFSLPFIAFALLVLLEGDPEPPVETTVEHWLGEAQREDGLVWKARRLAYDKLPKQVSEFLRLENPGERHGRQTHAIRQLGELSNEAARVVPVLTDLLAKGRSEEAVAASCIALAELGTNALAAMPRLLTMISNTPPYGNADAWYSAYNIEPTNRMLLQLATNILANVILRSQPMGPGVQSSTFIDEDEGMVWMMVYHLPEMRLPFVEAEPYLSKIFASKDARLTWRTLQAVRSKLTAWKPDKVVFSGEQLSRLLSLWDRYASKEVKRDSLYAAVDVAIQHEQTLPLANRLFAELLQEPDVTFKKWYSVHALFSSVIPPEPRRLATRQALDWVLEKQVDHPEDLGAFIRFGCSAEEQNLPAIHDWFTTRVKASTNPHQATDWSRHWQIYQDIEATLEFALVMLSSSRSETQTALLQLLANPDFRLEAGLFDAEFLKRYGIEAQRTNPADEQVTARLRSPPAARVVELLVRLLAAVNELSNEIEPKAAALTRLESLLAEFQQEVADAP